MQALADTPEQLYGLRHVGAEPVGDRDRLLAAGRFADDADALSGLEQQPDPRAHQALAVGKQDPNGRRIRRLRGRAPGVDAVENGGRCRAVCRAHGASLLDEPAAPANASDTRVSRMATVFIWLTTTVQW
jgi:hypothetical protein